MATQETQEAAFGLYGHDLFGEVIKPKASGPVAERFGLPPFTVLDARSADWQERKRAWLAMGIASEVGRGENLLGMSKTLSAEVGKFAENTSIFDPVLCELAYRWFSAPGAQIIDPFAGGSVRGIVAGCLGRRYWGSDLRSVQIEANRAQAAQIDPQVAPAWVCGDSMETLADAPEADLVFSCPPYGDLERYSEDPADLSTMEWHTFAAAYARIILRAVQRMKANSFACFVVGDFRDERGFYRNFVSTTIEAFEAAGARLYNEAILATPIGTAAMRVTKQFTASRKLAKIHQNVLVFVKGDPRKAADACGAVL